MARKRFPTRWDIDSFAPNNPVVLERADGHAVVVNSKVLKLANIDSNTPDLKGGFVEKEDDNGEPITTLIEHQQPMNYCRFNTKINKK